MERVFFFKLYIYIYIYIERERERERQREIKVDILIEENANHQVDLITNELFLRLSEELVLEQKHDY